MTRRTVSRLAIHIALGTWIAHASPGSAQPRDLLQFFAEEAEALQVITAARSPHSLREAPATVHVLGRQDLSAYGAFHLWDALRGVPGVDVFSARSAHGLVGIRGMSKINNNRTLILLDGRRALSPASGSLNWEALPVALDDIERIEIVEGPTSAVYGGSAVTGVINIITRQPASLNGVEVSGAGGERGTRQASVVAGRAGWAGFDLRASTEYRSLNRFEDADRLASKVLRGSGLVRYQIAPSRVVSVSGGYADLRTNVSTSALGNTFDDGTRGFVRADYSHGRQRLRASWMRGASLLESFAVGPGSRLRFDSFEMQALRRMPTETGQLVVGAEVRRDGTDSGLADATHDQWAVFGEHQWRLRPRLTLWSSGRIDRHPHTGSEFSPRITAVARPTPDHTLRLSVGTAFRHPTLVENHMRLLSVIDVASLDPDAAIDTLELLVRGNRRLHPESLRFVEAAHEGRYGRLQSRTATFYYELANVYAVGDLVATLPRQEVARVEVGYINQGTTEAVGAETEVTAELSRRLILSGSYSFQSLGGRLDDQATGDGTPHHKGAVRLRLRRRGLVVDGSLHRVGATRWKTNALVGVAAPYTRVDPYSLVNLSVRYRFASPLAGWEAQFVAFNLLADDHVQVLPMLGSQIGGQGGEVVRGRRALRLVYRF